MWEETLDRAWPDISSLLKWVLWKTIYGARFTKWWWTLVI